MKEVNLVLYNNNIVVFFNNITYIFYSFPPQYCVSSVRSYDVCDEEVKVVMCESMFVVFDFLGGFEKKIYLHRVRMYFYDT